MLLRAIHNVFVQLKSSLEQLEDSHFSAPCQTLSQATVGQHVRHIIELFQALENGYTAGVVDYENRKRDKNIETSRKLALSLLDDIYNKIDRPDKEMILENCYDELSDEKISIRTNYLREVAYNLEHTIHHMALIRIGIKELSSVHLPETFGVAPSTTKYNKNVHSNLHTH